MFYFTGNHGLRHVITITGRFAYKQDRTRLEPRE